MSFPETFNASKYSKWYFNIINNAKTRNWKKTDDLYFEVHHILPKSIGGDCIKENTVNLSAREHFICHLLLIKMCVDVQFSIKMKWALHKLTFGKNSKYNNHQYELVRKIHSKNMKQLMSGDKNPFKGKTHTKEHNEKISKSLIGKPKPESMREKLKGNKNSQGTIFSEEAKVLIRIKRKGQKPNLGKKGKKWFNDGISEFLSFQSLPNWYKGRLPKERLENGRFL